MNDEGIVKQAEGEDGTVLKIFYDDEVESPRTSCDNLGTMVCWHNRYSLGDEHSYSDSRDFFESLVYQFTDLEEEKVEEMEMDLLMEIVKENAVILPLYLFDHSVIRMRTSDFCDRWDSGQVGWVYVTHEDVINEYGFLNLETAEKVLKSEVQNYDMFLSGDVYGFILEDAVGNVIDSCWGFYGLEYLEVELKSNLTKEYVYLIDDLD